MIKGLSKDYLSMKSGRGGSGGDNSPNPSFWQQLIWMAILLIFVLIIWLLVKLSKRKKWKKPKSKGKKL
jgi:hypothetical protein